MRERRFGLADWSRAGVVVGALLLALVLPHCFAEEPTAHPTLALGSAAPDFSLPGIDGKTHTLDEYKAAKVLVIVFTCDHCPTAQLYESRLKKLVEDYKGKSVQFVMIEPNDPEAVRLDELAWTDVGDGLEDMKVRAAYRHFNFPYLYDGATQATANAYGPKATPHVFIFDAQRKLRFEGRVDNNQRESLVTTQDTRNAIDALLADKPVAVDHTGVFGTKGPLNSPTTPQGEPLVFWQWDGGRDRFDDELAAARSADVIIVDASKIDAFLAVARNTLATAAAAGQPLQIHVRAHLTDPNDPAVAAWRDDPAITGLALSPGAGGFAELAVRLLPSLIATLPASAAGTTLRDRLAIPRRREPDLSGNESIFAPGSKELA